MSRAAIMGVGSAGIMLTSCGGHWWQRKLRTTYTYSDARVQVAQDRYALAETFCTGKIGHSRP
jgi:hypothetical protein